MRQVLPFHSLDLGKAGESYDIQVLVRHTTGLLDGLTVVDATSTEEHCEATDG